MRLVASQVFGLAVLAAIAVRWPHTADQIEAAGRTFAFAVCGVALAVVAVVAVLVWKSQREEPYLG